jgi:hypothetical protein
VAHSVKALQCIGHDPEDGVLEEAVHVSVLAEACRAIEPGIGELRLVAVADPTPDDARLPRGRMLLAQTLEDFFPGWYADPSGSGTLLVEPLLQPEPL